MAYQFSRVDLRIFDFHLSLDPLLAATSVKPPMGFLGNPALYAKQFSSPPIVCGKFRIRPLRNKSRTYHHFWKYYTGASGALDPWLLLLPFVCEPTPDKLSVVPPSAGIRAFVRPTTYLFPFGWSNTIEMSLQGKLSPPVVRDFVGMLRKSQNGPFRMQGQDVGLAKVFREYSDQLKKACFVSEAAATDFVRLPKHVIVSVTRFDGPVVAYKSWGGDTGPAMPAADKGALHSMLLGEDVPMPQVAAGAGVNKSDNFLLTRYHGAGFAISYFDKGTLLFLQDTAKEAGKAETLRCFSSNILLCMMMVRSLLYFHNWPDTQKQDAQSLAGRMRDAAREQLLAIPARYTNPLCQTWFQHFHDWSALKPDGKKKPEDG
jgi:hypothetical protein